MGYFWFFDFWPYKNVKIFEKSVRAQSRKSLPRFSRIIFKALSYTSNINYINYNALYALNKSAIF